VSDRSAVPLNYRSSPDPPSTAASEAGLFAGVLTTVLTVAELYMMGAWDRADAFSGLALWIFVVLTLGLALAGFAASAVGLFRREPPRYLAALGVAANGVPGCVLLFAAMHG
jgi:hypothetical protein